MKKLMFLSVVFFFHFNSVTYPQYYSSLDGIENNAGETVLLFHKGNQYHFFNPVYSFNTVTFEELRRIDAFENKYLGTEDSKTISDFEFFQDGNFLVIGERIYPDNHQYVSRNDSISFPEIDEYHYDHVDISGKDPMKVYLLGNKVARSFDGGLTFPPDSVLEKGAFSKAAFDDETFFDFYNTLIKINSNGQRNVDTSRVYSDRYTKFIYDDDEQGIYLVAKSYSKYILFYSGDKGESWCQRYSSEKPIFVSIDNNGAVYVGDSEKILFSGDYGTSFTEYKTLPKNVVGIYKKRGTELLYAATEDKVYEITQTVFTEIASANHIRFPLQVGNQWVYSEYEWTQQEGERRNDTLSYTVVSDTIMPNGKKYYWIPGSWFYNSEYLREDHKGIYFYDIECEKEKLVYNYNIPSGFDTSWTFTWNSCNFPREKNIHKVDERTDYYFNLSETITEFSHNAGVDAEVFSIAISKRLGFVQWTSPTWDGINGKRLLACKIGGGVYGTFTDINESEQNSYDFSLIQNYPNPFNPNTTITYTLPNENIVKIIVYDMIGREVAVLVNERQTAGIYKKEFDASNLSSGVYIYKLQAGNYSESKKMILMK